MVEECQAGSAVQCLLERCEHWRPSFQVFPAPKYVLAGLLQAVHFNSAGRPAAEEINQNAGPLSGGQTAFENGLQMAQWARRYGHAVAGLELTNTTARLLGRGQALLQVRDDMVINQGWLVAEADDPLQARCPAQSSRAIGGVCTDEEVTGEERLGLPLPVPPDLDRRQIGLEALALQQATNLLFFMWLCI